MTESAEHAGSPERVRSPLAGLGLALLGFGIAVGVHFAVPWIPALTVCVVLGVIFTAVPASRRLEPSVRPGLALAGRRVLRIGVVLLGFKLSLVDLAGLGWIVLALVVGVVVVTFFLTWALGRAFRLPGQQPLLVAAGFSICGASAIGAMSSVTGSDDEEAATPVALVTLCGTLAIAILPALQGPLGLGAGQFGMWVGASVHDVGQVVATAQVAGATALAIAIAVKLTRVVLLAPLVAVTGLVLRRPDGARPALVPLFVAGFVAASIARTVLPLSTDFLAAADGVQFLLLGIALFGLGSAIRIGTLVRTGGRPIAVAGLSWAAIAVLSWGAVMIATHAGVAVLAR